MSGGNVIFAKLNNDIFVSNSSFGGLFTLDYNTSGFENNLHIFGMSSKITGEVMWHG